MPPSNAPRATSRGETYRASGLVLWRRAEVDSASRHGGFLGDKRTLGERPMTAAERMQRTRDRRRANAGEAGG
jgi:hypothetical protein